MTKKIGVAVNETTALILRIIILYIIYNITRIIFYIYNKDIIGSVTFGDIPSILVGGFYFDSASIFYVNLPIIAFSLLPFRFTASKAYQRALMVLFALINGAALLINMADIIYYEFKLAKIASDDLQYAGEDNFATLVGGFFTTYFVGFMLWLAIVIAMVWLAFRFVKIKPKSQTIGWLFYPIRIIKLALFAAFAIVAIRGYTVSKATFPLTMADATRFVKPQHASLALSNPFCLIRTLGQKSVKLTYFTPQERDLLFETTHTADSASLLFKDTKPNIVIITLESFGSAHIKALSDSFKPQQSSYTPFLDSLIGESMSYNRAFQSGIRSIDAMPAIWGSIPSFERHFLSLPQSIGKYEALPTILKSMGYSTSFHHGATASSLSFRSFGVMAGVEQYFMQEEYESKNGKDDFDGKWGIWDHKFLPFTIENISAQQEPFMATIFTMSSHNPYDLPPGFEGKFKKGTLEIHELISYSDWALQDFFERAKKEPWFENTLFVITADHGSGSDNKKYLAMPYSHMVPLMFYMPKMGMKGVDNRVASHIDISPTILGMLGYQKPYFAFGSDLRSTERSDFAVIYSGSAYYMVEDKLEMLFDTKKVSAIYDYNKMDENNLVDSIDYTQKLDTLKAYLQSYYDRLTEQNFEPKN